MTIDLYVQVQVYPIPNGYYAACYIAAYPSTAFFNPPVGSQFPPAGSTPTASGTSTSASPNVTLTGLTEADTYWLLVQNPQGHAHWFWVDWTSGLTSGDPMVVGVPLAEGSDLDPSHATWSWASGA